MTIRLQKILSEWGIASRREAEKLIISGRVRVNGEIAHLGQQANPDSDRIQVDRIEIKPKNRPQPIYLLLNKPLGVVCTCSDPEQRKTVLDLLPRSLTENTGIHPVGRLDINSSGALLLTNDGEFTNHLTHPRHQISKIYHVWIEGHPTETMLQKWRNGVLLEKRKTLPAQIRKLKQNDNQTLLEVILKQGRNRQIRKIVELLGYTVTRLHRIAIGAIKIDNMLPGEYRHLQPLEINVLKSQNQPRLTKVTGDI
jgi:23S rRNA pseudouridine2605 synthase